MDNYISARELRRIAEVVDSAQGIWDMLVGSGNPIFVECDEFSLTVLDTNGDRLGYVRWGEDGAAFYPDMEERDA